MIFRLTSQFTIKFWMDETSGAALDLKTGVPSYQVEDGLPRRRLCRRREESRIHLLIHLTIEEDGDNNRWCLWRPDHAGFDSRSIFEDALVDEIDRQSENNLRADIISVCLRIPAFWSSGQKRPAKRLAARSSSHVSGADKVFDPKAYRPG